MAVGEGNPGSPIMPDGGIILPRVLVDQHGKVTVVNRVHAFVYKHERLDGRRPVDQRDFFISQRVGRVVSKYQRSDIPTGVSRAAVHLAADRVAASRRKINRLAFRDGEDLFLAWAGVNFFRGVITV